MKNDWGLKKHMSNSLDDMLYVEWKYFNIMSDDFMAVFAYSVGNPRNIMNFGHSSISSYIFHEGDSVSEVINIPLNEIRIKTSGPDARFGQYTISSDDSFLRIKGEGKKVKWDLSFTREEEFHNHKFRIKKFPYLNSWIHWQIIIPHSKVTGTILLKETGRTIQVDHYGYVDGNRGKWIPFQCLWYGMGFKSQEGKIGLSSMKLKGKDRSGSMFLLYNGKMHKFIDNDFSIDESQWKYDKSTGLKIPMVSTLTARKGDIRIRVKASAITTNSIRIPMPRLFPDVLIFEQACNIDFKLYNNNNLKSSIKTIGLNEFTTKDR